MAAFHLPLSPRSVGAKAELIIHSPSNWEPLIVRRIKDHNMSQIITSFDLNSEIDPFGTFGLSVLITSSVRVDGFGTITHVPRHPNEQAADIVLTERDVRFRLPFPFRV